MAASLAANAVLTNLNLRRNDIRNEGAKAIAAALGSSALKKCDVRWNGNALGRLSGEKWAEAQAALREAVKGKDGFGLLV